MKGPKAQSAFTYLGNLSAIDLKTSINTETRVFEDISQLVWETREWRRPPREQTTKSEHANAGQPFRVALDQGIHKVRRANGQRLNGTDVPGSCESALDSLLDTESD